jgi:hypothetical protein
MVPTATAASTGIKSVSRVACYFYYFPYIKYKTYKTSSNSRRAGEVENAANRPMLTVLKPIPLCEKSVPNLAESRVEHFHFHHFRQPLHRFHMLSTDREKEDRAIRCITQNIGDLSA